MKEALFYKKLRNQIVRCELCPRFCTIKEGSTGFCRVRKNIKGKLYSLVYGLPVSIAIDPIEKKPLFHFAPSTQCLSIATVGCNLRCQFCQNYTISQEYGEIFGEKTGEETSPQRIIEIAKRYGVEGISYTYTEPTVFYEYALNIMKLAKKEGFYNVWVSNGYTNPQPIKNMARYLDAVNVDLKGDDLFYKKICGGIGIKPVHDALKAYKENNVWVEVTNLIIPGYNDEQSKIAKLSEWVAENLGKETPLHFSAFFPNYKMTNVKPTPKETIEKAVEIAKKKGLKWVYGGNVWGNKYESTWCWNCGTKIIERFGFDVLSFATKCKKCGEAVDLKGLKWVKNFK
jgi:pyruvate formate lyase activating enzyme